MSEDTLQADFRQAIHSGQAVVIVGAGVSIGATNRHPCASWQGLLHHGVQRCVEVAQPLPAGWATRVTAEINSGDLDNLLSAAEKITQKLGGKQGAEFSRWLRETVGALRAEQGDVLDALHALHVPLLTTNYDHLLAKGTDLQPITWMDQAEVTRLLRREDQGVLHLHGHWRRPESVILGIRSYETVLGDAHAQTILRALQTMKTLIFVGCGDGLSDPNFGALLQWTAQVFSADEYRRFRLCRDAEVESLRQQHPPAQRLFPIPYGPNHHDLAAFLRSCAPAVLPPQVTAPPTPATTAALPAAPPCFGRDLQVEELVAALLTETPPPIAILGPPGIGKSTLTLTVLHDRRIAAHYGTRRYFVRCDAAKSRRDLVAAVASVLGLPSTSETDVLAALKAAPTCLVLDNTETPWEAETAKVEEVLGHFATLPTVALVASVRGQQRPLGIRWREPIRLTALPEEVARQTFLNIAGERFATDPHLNDLILVTGGVPLALTLLACAAESEPSLEGLWRRWQHERTAMLQRAGGQDRLSNLELSYELSLKGPRMTVPAHRTALAHRLLHLLARLPNGLAWADLPEVLPEEPDAAAALLRQTGLAFDDSQRLRVLAPLRDYVSRAYPPNPVDLQCMAQHFVGLAATHGDTVGRLGGDRAVQRLLPEAANIEAMFPHALAADQSLTLGAAKAWGEFLRFTGIGSPAPLEAAAVAAQASGAWQDAADCIRSLGDLALARSAHAEARQRYEAALPLYQRIGDVLGEANCIQSLGDLALERSEPKEARRCYNKARLLYQRVGDVLGKAHCTYRLGDLALARSAHAEARQYYKKARLLYQRIGDVLGEANCIRGLGDLALARSAHAEARQYYKKARLLYQRIGDVLGEANCICGLGDLALARAEPKEARRRYEEALPLYQRVGNVLGEANCIRGLGDLALAHAEYTEARRHYEAARLLYQRVRDVLGEANCIYGLGELALAHAEYTEARRHYEAALPLYQGVGDVLGEANCVQSLGDLALERSEHAEARRHYEEALPLYQRVGDVLGEAHCICGLGDLALRLLEHEKARSAFTQALELYARLPEPYSMGQMHRRLARLSTDSQRRYHIQAARTAWESIDFPDLVAELDDEFGTDAAPE